MDKFASIFGGGYKDKNTKEYQESIIIGNILSKKGYKIKSGGYYGIMEAVSKGSFESGGHTIGYTCKSFKSTKGNDYLSETIISNDVYDRLRLLIEGTDVFIIQKGGLGTLSELFLTLDVMRKRKSNPIIILVGDFWNDIFNSIKPLLNEGEESLFKIISTIKEMENEL